MDANGYHLITCKLDGGPVQEHNDLVSERCECLRDPQLHYKKKPRNQYCTSTAMIDLTSLGNFPKVGFTFDSVMTLACNCDKATTDASGYNQITCTTGSGRTSLNTQLHHTQQGQTVWPAYEYITRWTQRTSTLPLECHPDSQCLMLRLVPMSS